MDVLGSLGVLDPEALGQDQAQVIERPEPVLLRAGLHPHARTLAGWLAQLSHDDPGPFNLEGAQPLTGDRGDLDGGEGVL